MASLSLPGKGVANSVGGEGGAGKGNNPWKGSIVQITGLALKKKKKSHPSCFSTTQSYLKAEKLNCSFGKQLLERKTSQQAAIPSPATLIQWPQPEPSHPPSSPAKAGWSRAD